ncbi:hypothetical protein [Ferruginibacter sp.]
MKKIIRITILVLIIFFGAVAIKTTYDRHVITFMDDWMDYYVFYILVALGIIAFLIEQHYYFTSKKLKEFMMTAIAALFCIIIGIPLIQRALTDEADLLLMVSGHSNANTIRRFEFKENKKFRLIEGEGMSSKLYYGAFSK